MLEKKLCERGRKPFRNAQKKLRRRKRKVRTTCNVAIFYLQNEETEIRDDVIAFFLELPQILTVGRWGSYSQDSLSAASFPPLHMFLKNVSHYYPFLLLFKMPKRCLSTFVGSSPALLSLPLKHENDRHRTPRPTSSYLTSKY